MGVREFFARRRARAAIQACGDMDVPMVGLKGEELAVEFRGGAGTPVAGLEKRGKSVVPPTLSLFHLEAWARERRPDLLARLRAAQRAVEEAFLPHEEEAAWAEFEAAKAALERAWREWIMAGGGGGQDALFPQEEPRGEGAKGAPEADRGAVGGTAPGPAPAAPASPDPAGAVAETPRVPAPPPPGGEGAAPPAPNGDPGTEAPMVGLKGKESEAVRDATEKVQQSLFPPEPGAAPGAFRSPWEDWLDAAEVARVPDLAAWRAALEEARAAGACALDTETTGLDPLQNRVRLIQLAVPLYPEGKKRLVADDWVSPESGGGARVYVLDLFALPREGDRREALEAVAGLVADPGVLKVGHNLKFDLVFLRAGLGGRRIPMERLFDTMLASQLVTAGDFVPGGQWEKWCAERGLRPARNDRGQELKATRVDAHGHLVEFEHDNQKEIKPFYPTHSLQQVAHRHLEVWLPKDLQASDWRGELSEGQVRYAARDAAVLLPLYEVLARLLVLNRLVEVAKIEFACLPAVVEIELSGMPFDAPRARELLAAAREEAARHRGELEALAAGAGFVPRPKKGKRIVAGLNPDSSQDVLDCLRLLAEGEGLLAGDRLSVGGEEFDLESRDETLSRLASRLPEGSPLRRFAEALRAYRAAKKRADFLQKWLELLHPATNRLHPDLRQINPQGVGRFSASNPNLQQCPRGSDIRQLFRASEGKKLVVADYSAIEMRIMAQLSGDKTMREAFLEDVDIHRFTAGRMAGKAPEDVTKEERQAAKAFNFGLIYGMQGITLQLYAETSYNVKMTLGEAEAAREAFFRTYPAVAAWHAEQARKGRERGFADYWQHDFGQGFHREKRPWVRTLGGRLRVWPTVREEGREGPYLRKAGAFTELYNTPDQGTGADMVKCAMARLYRELLKRGLEDVKLVATVHDELVLEAPEELAEQVAELLGAAMELTASRFLPDVPVEVEAAACETWAEK